MLQNIVPDLSTSSQENCSSQSLLNTFLVSTLVVVLQSFSSRLGSQKPKLDSFELFKPTFFVLTTFFLNNCFLILLFSCFCKCSSKNSLSILSFSCFCFCKCFAHKHWAGKGGYNLNWKKKLMVDESVDISVHKNLIILVWWSLFFAILVCRYLPIEIYFTY